MNLSRGFATTAAKCRMLTVHVYNFLFIPIMNEVDGWTGGHRILLGRNNHKEPKPYGGGHGNYMPSVRRFALEGVRFFKRRAKTNLYVIINYAKLQGNINSCFHSADDTSMSQWMSVARGLQKIKCGDEWKTSLSSGGSKDSFYAIQSKIHSRGQKFWHTRIF